MNTCNETAKSSSFNVFVSLKLKRLSLSGIFIFKQGQLNENHIFALDLQSTPVINQ